MEKYVITGGPSTGKTTTLESIASRGYETVDEPARIIINQEKAKQKADLGYTPILPETHLREFQNLIYPMQLNLESNIKSDRTFLDRSLVDGIAYTELGGTKPPSQVYNWIEQSNYTKVFFLEQLPFYKKDDARWEDAEQGLAIHNKLYEVYDRLGYDVIKVPFFDGSTPQEGIEARTDFILKHIPSDHYGLDKQDKLEKVVEYA
mgnify:FL=1|jgi:predicted ATPase